MLSTVPTQCLIMCYQPIQVAEWSKARVCGRSLAGVAGSKVCVVCVLHSKDRRPKPGQSGQRDTAKA